MEPMRPQPKSGSLYCPAWIDFVKRMNCSICGKAPPSDAHHYPPRGRGVTRDDLTMPACRTCHDICGGARVPGLRMITPARQHMAVLTTRSRFLEESTDREMMAYLDSRREWNFEKGLPF